MDPLIFIGIIVIFSILDSISRKKRTGMKAPQAPRERDRGTARPSRAEDALSYDAGPSYDELGIEAEEAEEAARGRGHPKSSSETLVPSDIWEEIAGLMTTEQRSRASRTRGSVPGRRTASARHPARPGRTARPPRRGQTVEPAPSPEPSVSRHGRSIMPGARVHLSHSEYGTDPSQRSRSAQDNLDPLARSLGADEATARKRLRGQSKHALRQAIILQEVLGLPAALRPDRFTD